MTKRTMRTSAATNKRNLLAAFLAGICVVLSCAQSTDLLIYAKDVLFNDDVAKLGAANVQEAVEMVAAKAGSVSYTAGAGLKIDGTTISVDIGSSSGQVADGADLEALQTKIAALEAQLSGDCPAGYTKDTTVTAYTVCKNGDDEMVKVGDFWADRYEMSIVDATTYNGGKCDGAGTQYGAGSSDDFPATFPDSAKVSAKLYACSKSGKVPSGWMTWFQAATACAFAGKHLCTNGEWQVAALGTPDDAASCNTAGAARVTAGSMPACLSQHGAFDMVGNIWEYVDIWGQAGKTWLPSEGFFAIAWPAGYGDGSDATYNLDGRVVVDQSVWTSGLPSAWLRGGGYGYKAFAGVFTANLSFAPSFAEVDIGARCCRR